MSVLLTERCEGEWHKRHDREGNRRQWKRWYSIALLSSAFPYLPPCLALWHHQILLRFRAHIHEMLNQVICNLNRFLQVTLISPSLSTRASVPSSFCGAFSGVRFFSVNSMSFGSLLLQHTKNLSHGTLWHKYILFSMTHITLLYNCSWWLVLALNVDHCQAITQEHNNIQNLWHNIREVIPCFVLLFGQYPEVMNCFWPNQPFRAMT